MSYISRPWKDEEENNQNTGTGNQGQSGVITGNEGDAGGQQQKQGRFVNIQQYLDANKPQIGAMADKAISGIEQKAGAARNTLADTQNQFKTAAGAVNTGLNQDVVGKLKEAEKFDENDMAEWQRMMGGNYSGPRYLDTNAAAQQYGEANDLISKVGDRQGQFEAFRQQYATPSYTKGMGALDRGVLSADKDAQAKFSDLGNRYQGFMGELDTAAGGAEALAAQKEVEATAAKTAALEALKGAQTGFQGDLTSRLETTNAERQKAYDDFIAKLATDEALKNYADHGIDVKRYLTKGRQASIADIATDTDRARAAALAKLGASQALIGKGGDLGDAFNLDSGALSATLQDKLRAIPGMAELPPMEAPETLPPSVGQPEEREPNSTSKAILDQTRKSGDLAAHWYEQLTHPFKNLPEQYIDESRRVGEWGADTTGKAIDYAGELPGRLPTLPTSGKIEDQIFGHTGFTETPAFTMPNIMGNLGTGGGKLDLSGLKNMKLGNMGIKTPSLSVGGGGGTKIGGSTGAAAENIKKTILGRKKLW